MIIDSDLLAQAAWKGTIVLAAGFAAAWLLARASAAFRHYLLDDGALPRCWCCRLAMVFSPKWSLPLQPVPRLPASIMRRPRSLGLARLLPRSGPGAGKQSAPVDLRGRRGAGRDPVRRGRRAHAAPARRRSTRRASRASRAACA